VFNSTAGNAALRPESADQLDLSYERYFGPTSSLTVGVFFKKLHNTLSEANFDRTFTNNGATETVQILGPINERDGGRVDGVEFAYQTFFDFLPGLLSGLGMQANYTYVGQHGIKNSNLIDAGALTAGGVGAFGAGNEAVGGAVIDSHKLEGVSTNTFNLVGLYEKGPIGIRLAYNWRSMYLTKNLDCCIGMPVFQKAAGFLDGSVRYSIGSHVELSLDATNLLDTRTVYQQQIFGDSAATPEPNRFSWIRVGPGLIGATSWALASSSDLHVGEGVCRSRGSLALGATLLRSNKLPRSNIKYDSRVRGVNERSHPG